MIAREVSPVPDSNKIKIMRVFRIKIIDNISHSKTGTPYGSCANKFPVVVRVQHE